MTAPRHPKEGDAEGLDETRGGQGPGQRKSGAAQGRDDLGYDGRRFKTEKQRLVGHPLAHKTVERGEGAYGDGTDEEE